MMNSFTLFFHDLPGKQDDYIFQNLRQISLYYLYGKTANEAVPYGENAFSFQTFLCLFCNKDQPQQNIPPNDETDIEVISLTKELSLSTFIV